MLRDRKFARKTIIKNIGKEGSKCKYGDKSNHSSYWTTGVSEVSILEGSDAESLSNSYPWQSVIVGGFTPIISTVF